MIIKNIRTAAFFIMIITLFTGCEKFLSEKSDKSLSIPTTLDDLRAMLNNYNDLNNDFIVAGEISSDDYYLSDANFDALYHQSDKRLYTWQSDYVISSGRDDWQKCYRPIYVCNSILHAIENNKLVGPEADEIRGQALVFRASRYLDGVQVWAPAYNKLTAEIDLGMVLRTDPDMNIKSVRSTVKQTYDLIIGDLEEAIRLLPLEDHDPFLPTKAVAYGLLARCYLYMGEYEKALQSAQNALANTRAEVLDFNTLDSNADFPIPVVKSFSKEIILNMGILYSEILDQSNAKISPSLYNLYDDGDLRKMIYFQKNSDNSMAFKGTHFGYFWLTNSPTPAELLLTISECNARLGNLTNASEELNMLAIKRWKTKEFEPYDFNNSEEALHTILTERRKELVMRGLRWADIKRLNRDGHGITLTRKVKGQNFILPPNDLRFAIAIPETIIEISGIQQNPR